jgi:beta-lactamase regulating signal transducer with metallopeptidase domain
MVTMDAVANWLWQGSVVALVATALLHCAPRVSATARYRLWWIALALVLLLPMAPSLQSLRTATAGPPSAGVMSGMREMTVRVPALPWWAASLVAGIWTGWLAASLGRALLALASLRRARRACRAFPNGRESGLKTWNTLCKFGRRATLVVSDDVRTAAVLGLASPVIAVAPGILRELSDNDLDRILVHEWAHVQRRDDVARVVQVMVRAIAGLHPAVWWIDRQIHLDRETACDDWAVNLTGSARDYAACLTRLAALPFEQRDSFLVPAAVFSSDLVRRVARLLDPRRSSSTRQALAPTAVLAPMIAAVAVLIGSVEVVVMGAPLVHPMSELAELSEPPPTVTTVLRGIRPRAMQRISSVPGIRRQRSSGTSRTVESLPPAFPLTRAEPKKPAEMTALPQPGMGLQQSVRAPDTLALPGIHAPISESVALPAPKPGGRDPSPAARVATPWAAAADAGVGVGRGSHKAAVATAGFVSKLSKSIAGVF